MAETITRQALREEVSTELQLRVLGTGTGYSDGPPVVLTVADLSDRFSEALSPIAAYLTPDSGTTVRRIIDFVAVTGVCRLNRAASSSFNAALECYFILMPSDWDEILNLALRRLFFRDNVAWTGSTNPKLNASVSLYALPSGHDWLQTTQQVERVFFRKATTTNGDPWTEDQDVPQYSLVQDANSISLLAPSIPSDITDLSLIIEAKHAYEELATDGATPTCPSPLAKASVKVEALRRIWALMGEEKAKSMFGAEMKNAESELLDAKKQWVKQVVPVPVSLDRVFRGPETAAPTGGFRW